MKKSKWEEHLVDTEYTDKDWLIDGVYFMIPILGQIYFLLGLYCSLKCRRRVRLNRECNRK